MASSAENGSSNKTKLVFLIIPLAKATLCFWPPDNWLTFLYNNWSIPNFLEINSISFLNKFFNLISFKNLNLCFTCFSNKHKNTSFKKSLFFLF
ncbi:hypothetical protein MmmBen326_0562 [Mycoplasma mycoides subsp. mycoides]|nr:hypothetical protein MmmBen326_0562 [Mycoplasma mycoides subsp. mycoides]